MYLYFLSYNYPISYFKISVSYILNMDLHFLNYYLINYFDITTKLITI